MKKMGNNFFSFYFPGAVGATGTEREKKNNIIMVIKKKGMEEPGFQHWNCIYDISTIPPACGQVFLIFVFWFFFSFFLVFF